MHEFVPEIAVAEQRRQRVHVHGLAIPEREAAWMVHPGVDRDHHQRAGETGDCDRDPAREMRARGQAVPPIDVDANEDRLDEERETLEREAESEDAPERGREVGPQQAHLEAQDRAGDHAHREQRDHHLRPALRQRAVERIARAEVQPLRQQHHRRERDPEAHQWDVHRKRQRLHLSRLQQIGLLYGRERPHDDRGRGDHHD